MTPTWLLLQVTVILVLALAGVRLARRSRAALRHVLLAGAFAVLLILPFASMVAPAIRVEVPASVHAAIAPLDLESDVATIDDAARPTGSKPAGDAQVAAAPENPSWSWPSLSTVLLATWIAGTAVFLLPVLVGLWQVRMLRRSGLPWRSGGNATDALATEAGVHRHVDVLLHESVPGPMTCGVVHPAIVLPPDADRWTTEDLARAIVHELEHIRRGDWVMHCLARVVTACYWFHPFVWVAWRQLVLEAERACDDAVIQKAEATAYADQLVVLAQRLSNASTQPQLAMASRRDLATRVRAVLDSTQRRGRAGALGIGIAVVICAVVVTVMSPLRVVAAQASGELQGGFAQDSTGGIVLKFDVVSIKPCGGVAERPMGSGRGVPPGSPQISPGYLHWECVSLAELIDQAYAGSGLSRTMVPPERQLSNVLDRPRPDSPRRVRGGPSWVDSDKYAIEVKISGDTTNLTEVERFIALRNAIFPPLRAMLEDRFQLKLRKATEEQPMYAMTVAKGGLKITQTAPQKCWQRPPNTPLAQATPPPGFEGTLSCSFNTAGRMNRGNQVVDIKNGNLTDFARWLSGKMDRYVLDKTGVEGRFTFSLEYASDDSTPADRQDAEGEHERMVRFYAAKGLPQPAQRAPVEADGPTIFKALEALGLKLEPTKGPAEYLRIESVQKPRPDQPAFTADAARPDSSNTPDGSSTSQSAGAITQGAGATPRTATFEVISVKPCSGIPQPVAAPPAGAGAPGVAAPPLAGMPRRRQATFVGIA
jgi:uncharacterized protein (TIGR03435 family)